MRAKELSAIIRDLYPVKQPIMVSGPPGIGKSAIIKQVAESLGIGFIDLRLIYLDPVDLRGIPMPDAKQGTTKWLTPDFLPREGKGILASDKTRGQMALKWSTFAAAAIA